MAKDERSRARTLRPTDRVKRLGRRVGAGPLVVGLIALVVLAVTGELLIRADVLGDQRQVDARVASEQAAIRSTLEAELNQTLFLAVGLVAYVEADPDLGPDVAADKVLETVYEQGEHLRNVALAPDNVITHIFPVEGNEAALGLDYTDAPDQLADVERAMQSRSTVLAGPVQLVQGGVGLINRTPVFLDGDRYWGVVSLVLDVDALLSDVEAQVADAPVRWAVRAAGRADGAPIPIRGEQSLFAQTAKVEPIVIPDGSWELAATPSAALQPSALRGVGLRLTVAGISITVAALLALLARERSAVRAQALQDPLTHLANRRQLESRLDELIGGARRQTDHFSLAFVDLDGFKAINDQHGHQVGDRVLTAVAQRLTGAVRDTDLVARVGGDEFIVVFPGSHGVDDSRAAAAKLATALEPPLQLRDDLSIPVGVSIGVGRFPEHGTSASGLISEVDRAMYQSKRNGEGRIRVTILPDGGQDTSTSDSRVGSEGNRSGP